MDRFATKRAILIVSALSSPNAPQSGCPHSRLQLNRSSPQNPMSTELGVKSGETFISLSCLSPMWLYYYAEYHIMDWQPALLRYGI